MPPRKKRRFSRRHFERVAALDVGDGSAPAACEILNISDGGARLRPLASTPDLLPDEFTLLLSKSGVVRRSCRVAWRSETEMGVQFFRS
jgi:PilZ domain-containing protein